VENHPNEGCLLGQRRRGFVGFYQALSLPARIASSDMALVTPTKRIFRRVTGDLPSRN
jgi:hypothetical protein